MIRYVLFCWNHAFELLECKGYNLLAFYKLTNPELRYYMESVNAHRMTIKMAAGNCGAQK